MAEPYKEVFTLRVFGELPFEKIGRLFRRLYRSHSSPSFSAGMEMGTRIFRSSSRQMGQSFKC